MVAVYVGDQKHTLEPIPRLLDRANQALQTLERYKDRLDAVSGVAVRPRGRGPRDACATWSTVLQRTEMVRRIAEEIEGYIVELGADGRLVLLQLEELHGRRRGRPPPRVQGLLPRRRRLDARRRHRRARRPRHRRPARPARSWRARAAPPGGAVDLDVALQPRGYRLLAKIPRLPDGVIDHIVDRFGNLQKIMRATIDDLDDVEGVGETRARAIKDGLSRLAETSHPRPLQLSPCVRCPGATTLSNGTPMEAVIPDVRGCRRAWCWSPTSWACAPCSTSMWRGSPRTMAGRSRSSSRIPAVRICRSKSG